MEMTQVRQTVEQYILDNVGMDKVDNSINLFEEGLVSSLFAIQLMSFLENNFGIEVTMDDLDLENFKSIDSIVAFLASKKAV